MASVKLDTMLSLKETREMIEEAGYVCKVKSCGIACNGWLEVELTATSYVLKNIITELWDDADLCEFIKV